MWPDTLTKHRHFLAAQLLNSDVDKAVAGDGLSLRDIRRDVVCETGRLAAYPAKCVQERKSPRPCFTEWQSVPHPWRRETFIWAGTVKSPAALGGRDEAGPCRQSALLEAVPAHDGLEEE